MRLLLFILNENFSFAFSFAFSFSFSFACSFYAIIRRWSPFVWLNGLTIFETYSTYSKIRRLVLVVSFENQRLWRISMGFSAKPAMMLNSQHGWSNQIRTTKAPWNSNVGIRSADFFDAIVLIQTFDQKLSKHSPWKLSNFISRFHLVLLVERSDSAWWCLMRRRLWSTNLAVKPKFSYPINLPNLLLMIDPTIPLTTQWLVTTGYPLVADFKIVQILWMFNTLDRLKRTDRLLKKWNGIGFWISLWEFALEIHLVNSLIVLQIILKSRWSSHHSEPP